MLKLAINFICKNEGHIVTRMLESARPIIDLVVAVDTGSSDNTIAVIEAFGKKYSIPTFVYTRPFDNFCNSRNHAMDSLREVVPQLGWDPKDVWGFFMDCDEVLLLSQQFRKYTLDQDMYAITLRGEEGTFVRQFLFHLSVKCWWEGPIHEVIIFDDPNVTQGFAEGLAVEFEPKGASWKGDLEAKFLNYTRLLTEYIDQGHSAFRWLYYTGESYTTTAEYCKSPARKKKWEGLAKAYYEKAEMVGAPTSEEKIVLQRRIGENKVAMGEKWPGTQQIFLKAFGLDPRRAESMAQVVTHYMNAKRWELAYLFSLFSTRMYHGRNPFGQGVSQTEDALYQWKMLLYHFICCQESGRIEEAKSASAELTRLTRMEPGSFTFKDLLYIRSNSAFYLSLRKWNPWARKNLY